MISTPAERTVVRQPAEWMMPIDDRILEMVYEERHMTPLALSREGLIERLDIGRKHANNRCRKLTEYGLLTRFDRGLYEITDEGIAYLDGELDASTLEPVDDA